MMWNSYLGVSSAPSACGSLSCSLHPSEGPTGPTWGTQWMSLRFAKTPWSCQRKGEERVAGRDRPTEIHPLKRLRLNERNELKQITEVQQSRGVDTRDEPESPRHSLDGSRRTGQEVRQTEQNWSQAKPNTRQKASPGAERQPPAVLQASGQPQEWPGWSLETPSCSSCCCGSRFANERC